MKHEIPNKNQEVFFFFFFLLLLGYKAEILLCMYAHYLPVSMCKKSNMAGCDTSLTEVRLKCFINYWRVSLTIYQV